MKMMAIRAYGVLRTVATARGRVSLRSRRRSPSFREGRVGMRPRATTTVATTTTTETGDGDREEADHACPGHDQGDDERNAQGLPRKIDGRQRAHPQGSRQRHAERRADHRHHEAGAGEEGAQRERGAVARDHRERRRREHPDTAQDDPRPEAAHEGVAIGADASAVLPQDHRAEPDVGDARHERDQRDDREVPPGVDEPEVAHHERRRRQRQHRAQHVAARADRAPADGFRTGFGSVEDVGRRELSVARADAHAAAVGRARRTRAASNPRSRSRATGWGRSSAGRLA